MITSGNPFSCVSACLGPGLNPLVLLVCARIPRQTFSLLFAVVWIVHTTWYAAKKKENEEDYLPLPLLDYCLYYYYITINTTTTIVRGFFSTTFCRLHAQTTRSHWLRVRRATTTTSLGPPISPRYLLSLFLFSSSPPLPISTSHTTPSSLLRLPSAARLSFPLLHHHGPFWSSSSLSSTSPPSLPLSSNCDDRKHRDCALRIPSAAAKRPLPSWPGT